jgi:SAM-dependent methyltransferase
MNVHPVIKKFYPEAELLGHSFVDGTATFYSSINSLLSKNAEEKTVLDLGCGRGCFVEGEDLYLKELQNFKGRVKKVIGLDVDKNAAINPTIDEFYLIDPLTTWPLEDSSIDICISDWVIEHVSNTNFFFSELNRVMKKGGVVCFRTTNKYGYIAFFSSLIPNRLHSTLLKRIQPDRKEVDVFDTYYQCNTKKELSKILKEKGFHSFIYYHDAEPNYFKFSSVIFGLCFYLQKFIPRQLRSTIFAFGIKK